MSIYAELGLSPIINASGAVTRLGGAPMPEAVLTAYTAAAGECVPIEQLQGKACSIISELTGTESALVTSGAAASLTLGAAAILTGLDIGKMERLPQTGDGADGMANEFVVSREQRNGYDHAVRAAGARFVEIGMNEIVANAGVRRTEGWEYEAAIGPNTAGVLYVFGRESEPALSEVVKVAHRHGLPVLVDAAGELLPRSNLHAIAATGADLVAFSGGKSIRSGQSTGILCGRGDLVSAAALQMLDMDDHWELWDPPANLIDKTKLPGLPRHGIGRGFKVSKEEIVALLTALRLFNDGAYDGQYDVSMELLRSIATMLDHRAIECEIDEDPLKAKLPLLTVTIDEKRAGKSALEICRSLRDGTPPIYLGHGLLGQGQLSVNPLHLDDSSATALGEALRAQVSE
jgi:L-seryl-tRNA(Ser) seleniumtransferase